MPSPAAATSSVVLALALVGCQSEDGLQLVSYHVLHEVDEIEALPEGYVLAGRHGIVGHDHDDTVRWELPPQGDVLDMRRLADDTLSLATAPNGTSVAQFDLRVVTLDGQLERSTTIEDPMAPLVRPQVVLSTDGGAWAFGSDWPDHWWGTVDAAGVTELRWSTSEAREGVLPIDGGGAYVVQSSWTDPQGANVTVELQRLDGGGELVWSTVVHAPGDGAALELGAQLSADGHGGPRVTSVRYGDGSGELIERRYDEDGELVETTAEGRSPHDLRVAFVDPWGRPLWLELDDSGDLVVRLENEAGKLEHEATFDGDGTGIMDALFVDDLVLVLTQDGLTRVRLPPP